MHSGAYIGRVAIRKHYTAIAEVSTTRGRSLAIAPKHLAVGGRLCISTEQSQELGQAEYMAINSKRLCLGIS